MLVGGTLPFFFGGVVANIIGLSSPNSAVTAWQGLIVFGHHHAAALAPVCRLI